MGIQILSIDIIFLEQAIERNLKNMDWLFTYAIINAIFSGNLPFITTEILCRSYTNMDKEKQCKKTDGMSTNSEGNLGKIISEPEEEWKDIDGYEGIYQVSSFGRVRSLPRKVWNYTKPGRILSPYKKKNGYLQLSLNGDEKREKHAYIHRLVAAAFVPNPNNLKQVNHINFNKEDNRAENLEWVTPQQNILHFRQSALAKKYDTKKAKTLRTKSLQYILDYKRDVCDLYDSGLSITDVSKELRIGKDTVTDILKIFDRV